MVSPIDLSVYNVLEALVSRTNTLARAMNKSVTDEVLRTDVTGKLIVAKIALARDDSVERLQALTTLVLTLTEHVLQTSVIVDEEHCGEPQNLLAVIKRLQEDTAHQPPDVPMVGAALGNLGLDPELWEVITTKAGVPVAALRFNGGSYPLPQKKMEAMKTAILDIIERE